MQIPDIQIHFYVFRFLFFSLRVGKNMWKEWLLTELTLLFTGQRVDQAHFPGTGGPLHRRLGWGVQLQGPAPAWRRLAGVHYRLHLKVTKSDTWQSSIQKPCSEEKYLESNVIFLNPHCVHNPITISCKFISFDSHRGKV